MSWLEKQDGENARNLETPPGFIAAIEAIYDAALVPERWPSALQAVADAFGDVGAILIYQREDGAYGSICSPTLEEAQRDYEAGEWWRQDIRFSRSLERGAIARADAVTDRDIASPEEMRSLPFYVQFLRSHGLGWFGGIGISPDPRVGVALSIQRAGTRAPFSEAELALLARVGRHVENALRVGIRLINADASQQALADALTRLGVGVFLLARDGKVLFSNPAGNMLAGDGLLVRSGYLTAQAEEPRQALRARIADAAFSETSLLDAPRPVIIRELSREGFLAVHVIPVRGAERGVVESLLADVAAIAVVTSSQPGAPADPALVRDLLGLTLAEARLAALIGVGLAPREASERLGITEETARTTLKRVFQKTGVTRQSELSSLLARMAVR
ncbi:MAG: helix-turn-helix transcriptional regulator [Hyphomicrobiales bacterium]|nr:MAG: helix-turn-helix transcriptional regulator [Hyphomicrobiales bacterium]